jgi:hypothetical protein
MSPSEFAEVKAILEAHGFEVEVRLNLSSQDLKAAYEQFIGQHGFEADNRLLFYFVGHGFSRRDGTKGYLVPADAPDPRTDEAGFLRKGLSMSQILT